MSSVGAYEAKTHLPQLLDRVELGESITITRHGKPVAVLSPAPRMPKVNVEELLASFREIRKNVKPDPEGWTVEQLIEHGRR
ncbi:MAG: type II toxin-antitoxin system Phd/YefM family antitoxin [Chloroflexota bacterium]|nr:MAG: type II toxin-antitoxin system Phd/YefM family antitoxin [Chloroflexota bacterium]